MQHASAAAVVKDRVFAGAQLKNFLQKQDRFFHRPAIRIGAKVIAFFIRRAAVIGDAAEVLAQFLRIGRVGARAHFQIGVAFVIAKQNVVARAQGFDQVVLKQQSFGFGAHHRRFESVNFAHHVAYARAAQLFLKITAHAFFQIFRLAYIEHRPICRQIAVHARQRRQACHLLQQLVVVLRRRALISARAMGLIHNAEF